MLKPFGVLVPSLLIHIRSTLLLCPLVQQLLVSSPEMMRWLTGAKSTSRYIVKMLCQAGVYGILGFTYVVFEGAEGGCEWGLV